MRAWYDLKGLDRRAAEDVAGFRDTDMRIRQLIAREGERGIPANRIVLAGFSQGGAVSLYTVPRFAEKLAGVMALSCYLPGESSFQDERASANDATPIFMTHGQWDNVLPMSLGVVSRNFLKTHGYAVEWHDYPMAHAVCAEEIADIREFLLRVLP
jgi:phospholipase/carboxylesterase